MAEPAKHLTTVVVMAIDPQRRESSTAAMKAQGLTALASLSPAEVLLLSGYWPVMGQSLVVVTCEGRCSVIVPEDELNLARSTSQWPARIPEPMC